MKKIYIGYMSLLCVIMALSVMGCRNDAKPESRMTAFERAITNADSVAVINLVDQFFGLLEQGQVRSAVAMLYKPDHDNPNPYAEPILLDNEEMASLSALFSAVPVYGHRIDYIKFSESYLNEVKCTAMLSPVTDDRPVATMSYYLKPINYLGGWVLCLMNSNTGDYTIVDNEDKDSLERQYQETTGMQ